MTESTSYPLPDPLDPATAPPLDQYADLVLKGGVVDGVIYPALIVELARQYRFQSIAGTSVGAIAASVAAAAEFSRRFGSDTGFNEVLRKLPDELAKTQRVEASGESVSKIRSLFQPDVSLRRLFAAFVDIASSRNWGKGQILGNVGRAIWTHYSKAFHRGFSITIGLGGFIFLMYAAGKHTLWGCLVTFFDLSDFRAHFHAALPTVVCGMLWALLLGLFGGLLGLVLALVCDIKKLTKADGFGFCSGLSEDGGKTDALIEWLHQGIQGAAMLPLSRPLTFGDLWQAPGGPASASGGNSARSIDLRMIATAVSHARPYEFPTDADSTRLFFRFSELEKYFPQSIIEHLRIVSKPYTSYETLPSVNPQAIPDLINTPFPIDPVGKDFRELPIADLPILVATRLSMNFPLLFKAIPLWSIDRERGRTYRVPYQAPAPSFKRTWFTDGGVTANFPVHFFDKPVPQWPTFGVFIAERSRDRRYQNLPDGSDELPAFYLPKFHTEGASEKWHDIDGEDELDNNASPLETLSPPPKTSTPQMFVNYLGSLVFTAKDWADNANMRMVGVRDRVVIVYKNGSGNGGLNLKLQPEVIRKLAYVNGVKAGQELVRKFNTDPTCSNPQLDGTPGWLDHRWVRLNAYLVALKVHLSGFTAAVHNAHETSDYGLQIDQAMIVAPLKSVKYRESTLTQTQADALKGAISAITQLEAELSANAVVQPYQPQPQPELTSRAKI